MEIIKSFVETDAFPILGFFILLFLGIPYFKLFLLSTEVTNPSDKLVIAYIVFTGLFWIFVALCLILYILAYPKILLLLALIALLLAGGLGINSLLNSWCHSLQKSTTPEQNLDTSEDPVK